MHKIYFIGFDGCMFSAVLLCFVRKQCNSYQPPCVCDTREAITNNAW